MKVFVQEHSYALRRTNEYSIILTLHCKVQLVIDRPQFLQTYSAFLPCHLGLFARIQYCLLSQYLTLL